MKALHRQHQPKEPTNSQEGSHSSCSEFDHFSTICSACAPLPGVSRKACVASMAARVEVFQNARAQLLNSCTAETHATLPAILRSERPIDRNELPHLMPGSSLFHGCLTCKVRVYYSIMQGLITCTVQQIKQITSCTFSRASTCTCTCIQDQVQNTDRGLGSSTLYLTYNLCAQPC